MRALLFVYDTSNLNSLIEDVQYFYDSLFPWNDGKTSQLIYLVGTKCGLTGKRQVNLQRAETFAKKIKAKHFLVSSKLRYGIEILFQTVAEDLYHIKKVPDSF